MKYSDEELQNRVEKGVCSGESLDERAYLKVFDGLRQEPYTLPSHFADKVIALAESKKQSLFREYFWFALGLLSFVTATIFVLIKTDFKFDFGSFKFVSGYWGLIAFGAAFILLIQIVDRQLVKNKLI